MADAMLDDFQGKLAGGRSEERVLVLEVSLI